MKNYVESIAVIGTIDPQTVVNSEVFTDVIDVSEVGRAIFVFATGDMAAEAIDAKVYTCDSDGSNPVALKSATQLAAHASNNDGKQIVIGVEAADLLASGKQHVKGGMVTGSTSGGPASCMVLGLEPRYGNAEDIQLATVVETVTALD